MEAEARGLAWPLRQGVFCGSCAWYGAAGRVLGTRQLGKGSGYGAAGKGRGFVFR